MTNQQKRMAMVAGVSLLLMTFLAGPINFGIVEKIINPHDMAATASSFASNVDLVRLGVLGFAVVILLDFLVAWSLYYLLKPIRKSAATLMALLRIVGATIFGASLVSLWEAAQIAAINQRAIQDIFVNAQSFVIGWNIGLGYFGLHLVLIAFLMYKGSYSKTISVLLVIAGIGYIADTVIVLLYPSSDISVSVYTFAGELLLMVWLLFKGTLHNPSDKSSFKNNAVLRNES